MGPRLVLLLTALLLARAAWAGEDESWPGDNPRNRRWDHPVIEFVHRADGRGGVVVRHGGTAPAGIRLTGWLGGRVETVAPGSRTLHAVSAFDPGQVLVLRGAGDDADVVYDRIGPSGADALTVGLLVERGTFEEGNRRFGSFVRRMRKSLEDLGALLDDFEATTPGSVLPRAPVPTRFRIQHVGIYDRVEGVRPALFDDHPDLDLVIACDEGGPLAGFWLPQYSIGHDFAFGGGDDGTPRRGLWSAWGEQALWHELLHFRGVPDSYVFHLPAAALPGRATSDVPLPERFRLGIMNSPYQEPRISALTAAIVNAKHGVRRVGACEEPDQEHGHMWRWIPEQVAVEVWDGDTRLRGVHARWWRSRPMEGLGDARRHGVPAGSVPDVDGASEVDAVLLGRADPRPERSLFLLVEVEHGGSARWDVIRLLELNEAWAAGHRERYVHVLSWAEMRPRTR